MVREGKRTAKSSGGKKLVYVVREWTTIFGPRLANGG